MNDTADSLVMPDAARRPLVVDLDGTLIRSDLLIEAFLAAMSEAPLEGLACLATLGDGRAALKARLADLVQIDMASLPFNAALLALLRAEHARGRPLYLASASPERFVRAMAETLGLFDGIFASDATENLKGSAKAAALVTAFGPRGFDYAGNSADDLAVWAVAHDVIAVNTNAGLLRRLRKHYPGVQVIGPREAGIADYLRALRPHQWLKNLLVFVPAFTAHRFEFTTGLACLAAFCSFSLCASSVYLLNDMLDLRSDRAHPTKRFRPFAAGRVDLRHGAVMLALCLGAAIAAGLQLPWQFLGVLAGYYGLTLGYSIYFKRQAVLDVMTLACLYGARLFAGAEAIQVVISPWLLTFSVFLFLCLALVKRCTELIDRRDRGLGDPPGRSYRLADLSTLQTMATTSGHVSVLVFILYINSPAISGLYVRAERLWLIPLILLFWISRVIILTQRGEMHDDPVLFAARDRVSLICAAAMAGVALMSI